MKWTSRILILAIFIAAMVGCQKGSKAEVSKTGRSSAKAATAVPKTASKSAKSGSAKSGSAKSGSAKSGSAKSGSTAAKSGSTTGKSGAFHPEHPGTLTMPDNGRSFDVKRGEEIVLKLDASHAAGFRWGLAEDIGAVLKQEGSPTFAPSPAKSGKSGSSGSETWRFRAVGAGRETVKLEYKRPWESIPEREFRFSVTVR